jgi:hypothetical protein
VKVIADYAKGFPCVDVFAEEYTSKVLDIGGSYGYSLKEIRASMRTGKRLDQRRALTARSAIEREIERPLHRSRLGNLRTADHPGITETLSLRMVQAAQNRGQRNPSTRFSAISTP